MEADDFSIGRAGKAGTVQPLKRSRKFHAFIDFRAVPAFRFAVNLGGCVDPAFCESSDRLAGVRIDRPPTFNHPAGIGVFACHGRDRCVVRGSVANLQGKKLALVEGRRAIEGPGIAVVGWIEFMESGERAARPTTEVGGYTTLERSRKLDTIPGARSVPAL